MKLKHLLALACASAAIQGFCDTEEDSAVVACGPEVGTLTITSSAKNLVIPVPFQDLSGGNVCVSNLVKTTGLTGGDELYLYNGTSWTAWVLNGTSKKWESVGAASIGSDGTPTHGTTATADETRVATGTALWLVRKGTPSSTVTVYGSYVQALSMTCTKGVKNLVSNPLSTAKNISAVYNTPVKGDRVYLPNADDTGYTEYAYNGSKWGYKASGTTGITQVDDISCASGVGFWIKPASTHDANVTLTWRGE